MDHGRKGRVVLLLATGCLMLAPAAVSAQTRQFSNWIVGCDNINVCTAIIFAEPSKRVAEPGIPFLQIRHHPHRDATPEIRLFDPARAVSSDRAAEGIARLIATPSGGEIAKGQRPTLRMPNPVAASAFVPTEPGACSRPFASRT